MRPWTKRDSTLAVSWMVSPRPIWMSFVLRKSGLAPSSWSATSNETRVRVLDFAKIIAHVWPASGCACRPRFRFSSRARVKIFATSAREKSVSLRKCLIAYSLFLGGQDRPDDGRRPVQVLLRGDGRREQGHRVRPRGGREQARCPQRGGVSGRIRLHDRGD